VHDTDHLYHHLEFSEDVVIHAGGRQENLMFFLLAGMLAGQAAGLVLLGWHKIGYSLAGEGENW